LGDFDDDDAAAGGGGDDDVFCGKISLDMKTKTQLSCNRGWQTLKNTMKKPVHVPSWKLLVLRFEGDSKMRLKTSLEEHLIKGTIRRETDW